MSEEYISKEEFKNYLEENISFGGTEKKFRFYDIIDSLPPADVRENIHGHWELDESDNSVTCDKCSCSMYLNDIMNGDGHFCPNCGADMREPKADDLSTMFENVDSFSKSDKEKMKSWEIEPKGEKGTE
jgi:acetyl-CoA carboxylase beta subunit